MFVLYKHNYKLAQKLSLALEWKTLDMATGIKRAQMQGFQRTEVWRFLRKGRTGLTVPRIVRSLESKILRLAMKMI
jgi:hypothetical protein